MTLKEINFVIDKLITSLENHKEAIEALNDEVATLKMQVEELETMKDKEWGHA